MSVELTTITKQLQATSKLLFNDPKEVKSFYKYAVTVYANKRELVGLEEEQINACILQMYLKGADPSAGEAFIVAFKNNKTKKTVAQVQTGYLYSEKKLWESGELLTKPTTFDLREGELIEFKPESHDVKYKVNKIKTYEDQKKRDNKPVIGYVSRFELINKKVIEKFFWLGSLEDSLMEYSKNKKVSEGNLDTIYGHMVQYSDSFRKYQSDLLLEKGKKKDRFGNTITAKGIFRVNQKDMLKKTAFTKAYKNYLPKTPRLKSAIQDINALNNATYTEFKADAKPEYLDNVNNQDIVPTLIEKIVEEPINQYASKDSINQIFKAVKDKDKKINVLKAAQTLSKKYGSEMKGWYTMSWKVLKEITDKINKKTGFKFDIEWPESLLASENKGETKKNEDK